MADFISLHHEEWVALISGLEFSAMVAHAKILFIPVVIVILGLSLLIWLYRLEREKAWNDFILWLIFSSIILISSFKTQKVVVELNPVVLNSRSLLLKPNIKKENLEVDKKNMIYRYKADVSGISALLAIPDKIASLMFNFMDANLLQKLAGVSNTIPLDNVVCNDPMYLAGLSHMIVLSDVFSLLDEKGQHPQEFRKKVEAFEWCYRRDFSRDSTLPFTVSYSFDGNKLWKAVMRGAAVGGGVGFFFGHIFGSTAGSIIGGIVGFFAGLTAMVEIKDKADCSVFVENGYKKLAQGLVEKCKNIMGKNYDGEKMIGAVISCIKSPNVVPGCAELKERTLNTIEFVKQELDKTAKLYESEGGSFKGEMLSLKDKAAMALSDLKSWWFSLTYMDYPLKFDLLAKGQGIVLALLSGMFPFVAVLSVIPTGRSFMNWSLLLSYMIAYFMVKLWIPLLFFIVNVAAHRLGAFAVGG